MSTIPIAIQIRDKDTIRWVVNEQLRRQQSSATRTANDLIRERLTQLDMVRGDCDPCFQKVIDRHGGPKDVTPAECEPSACPCGQWPGADEPESDPEIGGAG